MKALELVVVVTLTLKYLVIRLIIILILKKIYFSFKECTMYYQSIMYVGNPTHISDIHVCAFNDTEGISRWNVSFSLKTDIKSLMLAYAIMGKTNETNADFDRTLMRGNLDFCNIGKGMIGVFMQTIYGSLMLEHSNYHFGCPIRKGDYYASNVPAIDDKLLPTNILVPGDVDIQRKNRKC